MAKLVGIPPGPCSASARANEFPMCDSGGSKGAIGPGVSAGSGSALQVVVVVASVTVAIAMASTILCLTKWGSHVYEGFLRCLADRRIRSFLV